MPRNDNAIAMECKQPLLVQDYTPTEVGSTAIRSDPFTETFCKAESVTSRENQALTSSHPFVKNITADDTQSMLGECEFTNRLPEENVREFGYVQPNDLMLDITKPNNSVI
jgi:hypothetical protein